MEAEDDGSEWEDLVNEDDAATEEVREKVMVSTASQTGEHISLRSVAKEGIKFYGERRDCVFS